MRGLRIFLFISCAANVLYVVGLISMPRLLAEFGMAPNETLWSVFLVPLYVAISFGNWHAFRDPIRNDALTQMMIAAWGLLVPIHIFAVGIGIEPISSAMRLGAFDLILTAGLVYFYLKIQSPAHRT
jgi:hypothetical protein